ncbi:MAG: hypothetical protein K2X47_17675, partial [Bdellovibrionales bacterium]|nr:hypothetical protein [Bdellovibrionales bacterium]
AGKYQKYDSCCWQTPGVGQFRPLKGSRPFLGSEGTVEKANEFKVETVCSEESLPNVIQALKSSHPYEEPAYEFFAIRM